MPTKTTKAAPAAAKLGHPTKTSKAAAPPTPQPPPPLTYEAPSGAKVTGKMARLVELLIRPEGATITDLCNATGWQKHSVRGALAGALKHAGYVILSEKPDDLRRYRIAPPPPPAAPRGKKARAGGTQ